MVMESRENRVSAWAFLIGVILALIIGLSTSFLKIHIIDMYSSALYGLLVLIGLFVGFLNISERNATRDFLLAGAVLVIVSGFGMESVSGSLIGVPIAEVVKTVFGALLALFVPATIVVALKTVFNITRV